MSHSSKPQGQPVLPQLTAEWDRWKTMVRKTPDVREGKVVSSRDAIAAGSYDRDEILDATLEQLVADMGVRLHD